MIPMEWYFILTGLMFSIGVLGVLIRRNVIIVLMCIELMLNAVNLLMVAFSSYYHTLSAQVFVFFIMLVAAAEVTVGLSIFAMIYRKAKTTDIHDLTRLKW